MSLYENNSLNNQSDYSTETTGHNPDRKVFDGGTYSDPSTTEADVKRNNDLENGDHGTTTMTPTNDLPREADEANDYEADDDEDFDDTTGEDNLDDDDGFNANSDNPTERELTKSWIGNEKTVNDANVKGLEGEPMGGHNFGTSELEQKNNRDASSSEHHSLGLGNSAMNQPSEEISNPPEVENGSDNADRKKNGDSGQDQL